MRVTALALFTLLAVPVGHAAELFAPDTRSFTLENGLQVVVIPDHRTPVVTHMVWYKVGSADEPPGKTGVAHFLEHLLFKGTKAHPKGEFSKLVALNGGQENAFTATDYTAYYQRVSKEHLDLVMGLEADRMANLVLTEDDVTAEREVVREERRSRVDNEPGSQLSEEMMAALYRSHPYGRPVIGWEHEIAALNHDDALEFYNTYYTPNNAIVVVAGDVDEDEVTALAQATYGKLERRAEPGARIRQSEPPQRASRWLVLTNERIQQPTMQRYYDVPSYMTAPEGKAEALDLLGEILGGGATSRLYRSLVVERQMATSVGAWYSGDDLDNGRFGFYGVPRDPVTLRDLEHAIEAELERVARDGVTEKELERAKIQLIAGAVYAQDSQFALARVFGSSLAAGATLKQVQEWPVRIEAVTAQDIKQVANVYLLDNEPVTGYLVQDRKDASGMDKKS